MLHVTVYLEHIIGMHMQVDFNESRFIKRLSGSNTDFYLASRQDGQDISQITNARLMSFQVNLNSIAFPVSSS